MRSIAIIIATALALLALGCVAPVPPHRHARPHKAVVVNLDAEHGDTRIVVVHERPGPARHCRKHVRHWHCRR